MSKARQVFAMRHALGRRADQWRKWAGKLAKRIDGIAHGALHNDDCPYVEGKGKCGPGCTRWELQQLSNEVFAKSIPGKPGPKKITA